MGVLANTNVDIASARNLYEGSGQVTMDDVNLRYLAGKPQSASGTAIAFEDLKGAAYFTTSSGGTSIDVRASAITAGWDGNGPLWFVLTGNTYSGSTGTASLVVSGSFPKGLILQINSGVVVSGKGGAGGAGTYSTGSTGAAGGVAIAVSSYTGGTLYINNLGTLAGGGGGGGAGGGNAPYYQPAYTYTSGYSTIYVPSVYYAVLGSGGGGGSGVGAGGSSYYAAQNGSAGTISSGGAGGAALGQGYDSYNRGAGGAGGGPGSAGSSGNLSSHFDYNAYYNTSYYNVASYGGSGGGAGACTTGTVAASAVWLNTGTRYGTVG